MKPPPMELQPGPLVMRETSENVRGQGLSNDATNHWLEPLAQQQRHVHWLTRLIDPVTAAVDLSLVYV